MNLLAVVGNPVSHSLSPQIHEMFAAQFDLNISYEKIESPLAGFRETAEAFIEQGAIGFNITVPFKFEAFQLVDTLSRQAKHARAVNTVKRDESGLLEGYNTDGLGLVKDITQNLGWSFAGKHVLILGAGGAVSGILEPILNEDPNCIHIYNRTHAKAETLADQYPSKVQAVVQGDLLKNYDLVISGSSAGLASIDSAGTEMLIPQHVIGENTFCYDLIYSKFETPFLSVCRSLGAKEAVDGLGMLAEQAALAFEIWFGELPNTGPIIKKLR
jgi:shikimate dehydrogenase